MIIEKKVKGERQSSRHSAWAMGSSVGSSSVLDHWLYLLLVITLAVTEGNVWTSHIFLASSAGTATQWLCFLSVQGRKRARPTLGYRGPCTSVLPPEAVSPWTLGGKASFCPLELSPFCSGPCEADVKRPCQPSEKEALCLGETLHFPYTHTRTPLTTLLTLL